MMNFNNSDKNQVNNGSQVVKWQFFKLELIKRFSETVIAEMIQLHKQSVESEKAKNRIYDLNTSAKRQASPQTKKAFQILVIVTSTITFSAGGQFLTSRLGNLSLPASLLMGGVAGALVDKTATNVITRKCRKRNTEQALQDIEAQKQVNPPVNEFGEQSYQTQTALVLQVEGKNLEKPPILDLGLAVGLSGAEYAMSLAIVGMMRLPGGFLLNAIAAGLPVIMLWAAASLQSNCFEMPEHDRDLIEKYQPYLKEQLTAEEHNKLALIDEEIAQAEQLMNYELALETCRQQFVTEGDSSGILKNWAMADANFKIDWLGKQSKRIEQDREQQTEQRYFQFKEELAELDKDYQAPVGTYSPEQIQADKDKWLKEKSHQLQQSFADEIKWLNYKFSNKLKQIEEGISAAQKHYQDAAQAWQKDNPDDLRDVA